MNIDVNYVSPPPWGYSVGVPKLSTPSAYVSGRSALVERVHRLAVMVDPSWLSNPDNGIDGYFNVTALDASGHEVRGVMIIPDRARVRLPIVRVPATKTVGVSVRFSGQPKFGYEVKTVDVRPNEVTIKGRAEVVRDTNVISTDRLNVEGAAATITTDLMLHPPAGVEILGRRTVRVTVKIEPVQ